MSKTPPSKANRAILVRLDPALAAAVMADAKIKGQSLTVWMGRAAQIALGIPLPGSSVVDVPIGTKRAA
jgi:hypothetical protein